MGMKAILAHCNSVKFSKAIFPLSIPGKKDSVYFGD